MKKPIFLRSIYTKFTLIFLGIWWFLNSLTFGIIMRIMSGSVLAKLPIDRFEFFHEFNRIRAATGLTFLISAIVGTVIILAAVKKIVRPIKLISEASREVAKGNFDTEVKIETQDEVGQLASDFNVMTKELRSLDHLHKEFVANVSHEFKTPITSINGFAKLIRDGKLLDEQLIEYSDIIVSESERLSLLSSKLLKLSELDNRVIHEQVSEFFLDEQLRKTILILEVYWEKKDIQFDIELEKTKITGAKHLLQEVWMNLIHNAIKFSNPKGVIKINLHREENIVKVSISDAGIGIVNEDKERIFERFFKGDKSRSKEGNGLGLVIVKRIIELSNGKIYFESQQQKGTTFTVELPI